jgi:hypothetical protein
MGALTAWGVIQITRRVWLLRSRVSRILCSSTEARDLRKAGRCPHASSYRKCCSERESHKSQTSDLAQLRPGPEPKHSLGEPPSTRSRACSVSGASTGPRPLSDGLGNGSPQGELSHRWGLLTHEGGGPLPQPRPLRIGGADPRARPELRGAASRLSRLRAPGVRMPHQRLWECAAGRGRASASTM